MEKGSIQKAAPEREDWMAMTGMMKTYTKADIRPKREDKDKKHIDSYNPATSSRELNPHWKDGGKGLPQTPESFRKSNQFLKPSDDDDYYTQRTSNDSSTRYRTYELNKNTDGNNYDYRSRKSDDNNDVYYNRKKYNQSEKTYNWKKSESTSSNSSLKNEREARNTSEESMKSSRNHEESTKRNNETFEQERTVQNMEPAKDSEQSLYLSNEKMNKLGAKIVKAEIMGDMKLVAELKAKLEAAREYRKQNPNADNEEHEQVMLISTNSSGNSRPLAKTTKGDARSKGGKRKAETHVSGERAKYFGNDDKYNLAQMVCKPSKLLINSKNDCLCRYIL